MIKRNESIEDMFTRLDPLAKNKAAIQDKIAKKYYASLENQEEAIEQIRWLLCTENFYQFGVGTKLAKLWIDQYDEKEVQVLLEILKTEIDGWGKCDQFCYRVLNPLVEKGKVSLEDLKTLAHHSNPYARRASIVALLHSSLSFTIRMPFEWVEQLYEILKTDDHDYVKKGVRWVLKYAKRQFPDKAARLKKGKKQDIGG